MGLYEKIVPNNDIDHSARRENDVSDLLNRLGGTGVPSLKSKGANYSRIVACNFGTADLTMGMAVKFTGKADESGTAFDVEKATDLTKPYGILLNDLPKTGSAGVLLSGATIIEVELKSASHEYAAPSPAGTLESADSGNCRILWRKAATGKQTCLILLGGGGGGSSYKGAFTVIDVSKDNKTIVRVCDGTNPNLTGNCGIAWINNKRFSIPVKEFTVESAGYIILSSEYNESGKAPKQPEMTFEKSLPSDNDLKSLNVIARIGLSGKTPIITQEQHGMVQGFIWGNCEDDKK